MASRIKSPSTQSDPYLVTKFKFTKMLASIQNSEINCNCTKKKSFWHSLPRYGSDGVGNGFVRIVISERKGNDISITQCQILDFGIIDENGSYADKVGIGFRREKFYSTRHCQHFRLAATRNSISSQIKGRELSQSIPRHPFIRKRHL